MGHDDTYRVSRRLQDNEASLVTERRAYFFNHSPAASIVRDTPNESELYPAECGVWFFE